MKLKYSQNIEFSREEIKELILEKVLEKAPELTSCLDEVRVFFFNKEGKSSEITTVLVKLDREIDA
jgi:hypothetical protein